jgi:hypothetical protein
MRASRAATYLPPHFWTLTSTKPQSIPGPDSHVRRSRPTASWGELQSLAAV